MNPQFFRDYASITLIGLDPGFNCDARKSIQTIDVANMDISIPAI